MKILYLTDNREDYKLGYYHVDYPNVFRKYNDVELYGPGYAVGGIPRKRGKSYDLVVFGHGAWDRYIEQLDRTARRVLRLRPSTRFFGLDLGKIDAPKIFLSKNDFKRLDQKRAFCDAVGVCLFVTFWKCFAEDPLLEGLNVLWQPFAVDPERFRIKKKTGPRPVDVGFLGSSHKDFIGEARTRFVEAIGKLGGRTTDLILDDPNRHLLGEEYVDWMNDCSLVANTISADDIVNPRWVESMACGAVPLAPRHFYEGLLRPDVHYVAVEPSLEDLEEKVDAFFGDRDYREKLLEAGRRFVEENTMDARYRELAENLGPLGISLPLEPIDRGEP